MDQNYRARRRNVPAKRKRRRTLWHTTIRPLLTALVVVAFAVASVSVVSQHFTNPIKQGNQQSQLIKKEEANLTADQRQIREFKRQIRYSKTPEGAAQAARKLGWVKPGEVIIILPDECDPQSKPR